MNPVQTNMHAKEKNGIQISKENCEQRETHKKNHGNHESHGAQEKI